MPCCFAGNLTTDAKRGWFVQHPRRLLSLTIFPGFNTRNPNDLAPSHTLLRSKTSRKPHRSSPLAGPAVLPDATTSSKSESRISSSLSLCDLGHLEVSSLSSQGLIRPTSMPSMDSAVSYPLSQDSSRPRQRSMAPKELIRPRSAPFPSGSTLHGGCPPGLRDGHLTSRERRNSQGCPRRYSDGLALSPSLHPADTPPIPTVIISEPEPDVVEVPQIPPLARTKSQSKNSPRDNSWYTFNTYVETPRFSRLSLAAESVVMPVSAKEHKKRQQQQRPQHSGDTPSGSGSLPQSTDVGISTGRGHCKEVNQQSLIGGLSSSMSRRSTRSNGARQRALSSSPASPASRPKSECAPDTLQTSLTHSLLVSTLPSSTSLSSSSPDSSPHRTRSISFTDSLATTFFVPSTTSSSQTSTCDDAAAHHQREGLITIQHCARKPSIGGAKVAKKKSLLARLGRWTVTSSTVSLPVTISNKKDRDGAGKKSTQPLGQSRTEKSSRSAGIRGFFRLFVSSE